MTILLAVKGPRCGAEFSLGERTRIGRDASCEIELPDREVSRFHAEIVEKRKAYILCDLDSKNRTLVNGKEISEQVILRNDEIRIGSSVLVFDPDFMIQNARYSGTSVYVSAPLDETIEIRGETQEKATPPLDDKGIALVSQLTDLLSPTHRELPGLLHALLERLVYLFHGERGFIMLWDPVLKELQPMVTVSPDKRQIAVSRKIVNTTFYEKTALISSGEEVELPYAEDREPHFPRSSISAPLMLEGEALGLVYIDRPGRDHFDLRSLAVLQPVGKLIAYSIEQSRYMENILLQAQTPPERDIIGASSALMEIMHEIDKLCSYDTSVLILGETGVGKEVIARAIHEKGSRRNYPFIVLNCTAIPEDLFESELFGHEKGAFTGADRMQRGKIELAHGGTLLLDEIGDLKSSLQPKLLRFLQEKNFYRVGGARPVRVDVRVIASTNSPLEEKVRNGEFREDLFYRLSVMKIRVPPLRERKEDIRLLAEHYLKLYAVRLKKTVFGFSDEAIIHLEKYAWPGNVRELINAIERAVILSPGKMIKPEHLLLETGPSSAAAQANESLSLQEMEKQHIARVLEECDGNLQKAARILGIHRNTLSNKLKDYHPG